MLLLATAFVLITIFVGLIIYARWHYGSLEKLGIPMAGKPFLIFGNTLDAFSKSGGLMDIERFKKLGPIYGVYEGRSPQIHICDAELIRLVTTKDAEYFNDKRRLDFKDPILNEMPDFQEYEKWKVIRGFLTPAFSSAKLKLMSASMQITLKAFCDKTKESIESSPNHKLVKYNLREEYFSMLTDMISRCCFSIEIGNPYDSHNMFVNIVRGLMTPSENSSAPMLEILSYSFPFLSRFSPPLFDPTKAQEFKIIFKQMMEARRKSGEKKKDVVDLCIEQMDKLDTPEYKRLKVTEDTVMCQAFVFFFAGQDQISTISSVLIHYLLENPEIEQRLYNEVDAFLEKHDGKIGYENISELQFLNACITETIRFVPFFSRTERVCTKNWESKEFNLKIKKGWTVQIPIWASNRNPKYIENPEKFDPDRFMPGRKELLHQCASVSFGFGPRNCIGQKFSMDTMMLLNTFIFKNFKFYLREDSKPVFIPAGPFFSPHNSFYFDITLRN